MCPHLTSVGRIWTVDPQVGRGVETKLGSAQHGKEAEAGECEASVWNMEQPGRTIRQSQGMEDDGVKKVYSGSILKDLVCHTEGLDIIWGVMGGHDKGSSSEENAQFGFSTCLFIQQL